MPIVDFHNHYYPPAYLDALRSKGTRRDGNGEDTEGNPLLYYPGDYNIVVQGHRDIEYRVQHVLDELGVDRQVVTLTTPGTHVESTRARRGPRAPGERRVRGGVVATRGRHFAALATLPLNDPAASVRELERAMTKLGLPGAMVFSNINGVPLADERFWPVYRQAKPNSAPSFTSTRTTRSAWRP